MSISQGICIFKLRLLPKLSYYPQLRDEYLKLSFRPSPEALLMSKLFLWSVCRAVLMWLWGGCSWAWMQAVPLLVSHWFQPFWILLLLLCVMLHIRFSFCTYFSSPMDWSLRRSCHQDIQSSQWVARFGLSSQGYWHRDCKMATGRKRYWLGLSCMVLPR